MSTQDIWTGGTGNWNTPASWSTGADPSSGQDAFIGESITATVTTTANETVNSIGVAGNSSILEIANDSTFTATDGTVTLPGDTGTLFGGVGPSGNILVQAGSILVIGDIFDNEGAIDVGYPVNSTDGGNADLKISGQVTLTSSGFVDLGNTAAENPTLGFIQDAGSSDGLTNANNSIIGDGHIELTNFDNQSAGVVEVNGEAGVGFLQVYATGTWSNEGKMIVEPNVELDLGKDSTTTTLANSGNVTVNNAGDLAISGDLTLTGPSGVVTLAGQGAEITTSDGTPTTFVNENTINAEFPGRPDQRHCSDARKPRRGRDCAVRRRPHDQHWKQYCNRHRWRPVRGRTRRRACYRFPSGHRRNRRRFDFR